MDFKGRIESQFLFRTALSKSILPYALFKPDLVVLPLIINEKHNKKSIILHNSKELMKQGYLNASKWFTDTENIWQIHRTENNKNISSENYLNWQNKLTEQNLNFKFLVLYNSSAKDANATVVYRNNLDLEFFVESKGYVFYTEEESEAYYLTAILNSAIPNEMMKDFQSKGLFGARDVHKKILDIYYPKYDAKSKTHQQLAALSKICHQKAQDYLQQSPPQQELSAIHLGRLRVAIKKYLSKEMAEIDILVGKVIG